MTKGVIDHDATAYRLLGHEFKGFSDLCDLVSTLMAGSQPIEEAMFRLKYLRTLALADGKQLDDLGDLLSEPRGGKTDAAYRAALNSAVLRNLCDGTPDSIIRYVRSMNGNFPATYERIGRTGFRLTNRGISVPGLPQLVRDVTPVGVGPIEVVQAPDGRVQL